MGLRPAKCYTNKGLRHDRPYTRIAVTVPEKNYIGTSPGVKTRMFNMGNPTRQYTHLVNLISDDTLQIRDNAIESVRLAVNRYLAKKAGKDMFFMRIRLYPHHILRENKQAQGAHADRIQKGMSHPFGRPIGRAVRVKKGQIIMSVLVEEQHIEIAKEAYRQARGKLPCTASVEVTTDVKSIGSLPSTYTEEVEEEEETKAETAEAATTEAQPAEAGKKGEAKGEKAAGAGAKEEKPKGRESSRK